MAALFTLMIDLLAIGFRRAGCWRLIDDRLELELGEDRHLSPVLYAFVLDGRVMYVGKSARSLVGRLNGYRTPGPTQRTNIRNHDRLVKTLRSGGEVTIFVYHDLHPQRIGAFTMNTAAGLEDDIIRTLCPPWNGGGSAEAPRSIARAPAPEPPRTVYRASTDEGAGDRFTFILRPTYHRTGFFNVPVAAERLFGPDGSQAVILLGDTDHTITARINRACNNNRTPRIMGGPTLRQWFQVTGRVGTIIAVANLSYGTFRNERHVEAWRPDGATGAFDCRTNPPAPTRSVVAGRRTGARPAGDVGPGSGGSCVGFHRYASAPLARDLPRNPGHAHAAISCRFVVQKSMSWFGITAAILCQPPCRV